MLLYSVSRGDGLQQMPRALLANLPLRTYRATPHHLRCRAHSRRASDSLTGLDCLRWLVAPSAVHRKVKWSAAGSSHLVSCSSQWLMQLSPFIWSPQTHPAILCFTLQRTAEITASHWSPSDVVQVPRKRREGCNDVGNT